MSHRLSVAVGAGFAAAAVSAMVVLAAPVALAEPAGGGTDATSAPAASNPGSGTGEPTEESESEDSAVGSDEQAPIPDSVEEAPAAADDEVDTAAVDPDTADGGSEKGHAPNVSGDDDTGADVTDENVDEFVDDTVVDSAEVIANGTPAVDDSSRDANVAASNAIPPPVGHGDDVPVTATPIDTATVPLAETATEGPTRAPSLLNVVGSLILNTLVGLIQLFDGPPVLPANSTVTVRTSTLRLPIGAGRTVQADWYFPEDVDESTRLVYFQHGFLASGPMYSYTAARLAERTNAIVVAPSLSSNFFAVDAAWVGGSTMHRAIAELFLGDRDALTESAGDAAGFAVTLPNKFVLVGHSAGGTLVASAAGFMADGGAIDDLVGVVLLDGVEPAGSRFVSDALSKLRGDNDRPIYLISSDRYFWSRNGDMADKLTLARPDRFSGVGLDGGLHIDYMEGGNPVIQFLEYLTAGFSLRTNIDAASAITAGWVNDLFAGRSTDGIYGAPEQSIPVVTPSGTATAVVLPLGVPARPVWPPLLDSILTAIFDFGGRYLFVYEPLRGVQPTRRAEAAPTAA